MPKFVSTLHFSKCFALIQLALLTGSLVCVFCLSWSPLAKIALIISLLTYSAWNFYSHSRWHAIGQDAHGWFLQKPDKKLYITPSGDSTVTSVVSILRYGKFPKRSQIIFKDSMPIGVYRHLIVRFRYFI